MLIFTMVLLFLMVLIGTFSRLLLSDNFDLNEDVLLGLIISYIYSIVLFFLSMSIISILLGFVLWFSFGFVFSIYRWKKFLEETDEDRDQYYDNIRIAYLLFCWPLALTHILTVYFTSILVKINSNLEFSNKMAMIYRKISIKFLSFYGK